jgi:DnaK suppressor protein
MTKIEIEKYKRILLEKQAELERFVRNRDGIAIEKAADAIDEVQHATERELAIRNLDRETILLRNVRSALRRIADGSFGICMHCDEEISLKRINGRLIAFSARKRRTGNGLRARKPSKKTC